MTIFYKNQIYEVPIAIICYCPNYNFDVVNKTKEVSIIHEMK